MTPFAWTHFLEFADTLRASDSEAALRSAVSRAYYAAFHEARRHVQRTKNVQFARDGRAHEQVPAELCARGASRIERGVARNLEMLKKARHDADYELQASTNWTRQCATAIDLARHIVSQLCGTGPET